jgi:[acyl-carrier-protein] S-malonyltransferase
MGRDFNDNFEIAKLAYEEIEDHSQINLRKIIFENEGKKLDLTQFTQICIFATSYVIFKTYLSETDLKLNNINIMMGHSLGEYTALACSNKISLKECSTILKIRGELMNNAVIDIDTGMAALIGKDSDYIQKIIYDNNLDIEIANDNSPFQIVISGEKKELNKSKDLFLNMGIKKFLVLNVSAAFHSRFMNHAQEKLSEPINLLNFVENKISIISNYDANIYNDIVSIKKNLQLQMANRVRWTESIKKLEEIGEKDILEFGPGKVLGGLINRISKNFYIKSINTIEDL